MSRAATHHIPLNLKMSADRVRIGKAVAQRHGTSVSALVSEVFGAMERMEVEPLRLNPILERLAGVIPDPGLDRKDVVMEELERKYGMGTAE